MSCMGMSHHPRRQPIRHAEDFSLSPAIPLRTSDFSRARAIPLRFFSTRAENARKPPCMRANDGKQLASRVLDGNETKKLKQVAPSSPPPFGNQIKSQHVYIS
jgi:hypothetical protein